MTALSPSTALASVLVVEVGQRIAAGACGGLLAQLGMQVIALEPSPPGVPGASGAHGKWRNRAAMLAGKESLSITCDEDRETAASLIARADIVILSSDDGLPGGNLWDAPRPSGQIVCDITAFGHTGPLSGRGGAEPIVAALAGIVDTTGPADQPPTILGSPVLEMSAAVFAASAIMAALRVRRLHHFGQRIDVAVFDTAVNELVNFLPLHFEGKPAGRSGNRHPLHVPWGSYRARDGYILICASGTEHATRVFQAIGRPDMATDERYATSSARHEHYKEIDALIEEWTSQRTVSECEAALLNLGVACGPIIEVERLQQDKNVVRRGCIAMADDPVTGTSLPVAVSPVRLGAPARRELKIPPRDDARNSVIDFLRSVGPQADREIQGDISNGVRPLSGLRVVEIGQHTVAPLAGRHLGALGADVIKVEPPVGDAIRAAAPLRADGQAHIFAMSNTDKRGLVLNLKDPAHGEMLHKLLDQADVLIENMRPGALAKLGFDGASLRKRHPRLIYCPISGFGMDSAYPGRRAMDTVVQAMSGLMSTTLVNGVPMKAGISVCDMLGGEFGLFAVLAALEVRDRTGVAEHFDLSMQDAAVWMTQLAWPGSQESEPFSVHKATDGWVVAAASQASAQTVAKAHQDASRESLQAAFIAAGIDSAAVLSVPEVTASAQVATRGLIMECPSPDGPHWRVLGPPMRLLGSPATVRSAMGLLGRDDAAVIQEFGLRAPAEHASKGVQHA